MAAIRPVVPAIQLKSTFSRPRGDAALGFLLGTGGGLVQAGILHTSLTNAALLGGVFGLVFGLSLAKRASTAGAGLIWGLSVALLLWFMMPTVATPSRLGIHDPGDMLEDARNRFPELVAYLVCLGMPTGLALGIRGSLQRDGARNAFRWGRAIVPACLAAIPCGLLFAH